MLPIGQLLKNTLERLTSQAATFTPEYKEKYQQLIENFSKLRPEDIYKGLFTQGDEIRLPFNATFDLKSLQGGNKFLGDDNKVIQTLRGFGYEYDQIDYMAGLVNGMKIGKLLQRKANDYHKGMMEFVENHKEALGGFYRGKDTDLHSIIESGNLIDLWASIPDDEVKQKEMHEVGKFKDFYEEYKMLIKAIKYFEGSELRRNKGVYQPNTLEIVITKNPHDIAQMSTHKNWGSCMSLGTGGHYESVYCSVAGGDLVAYLIKKGTSLHEEVSTPENEGNTKNSIYARVLIRRFANAKGESAFVPEDRSYTSTLPSDVGTQFVNTVYSFLQKNQPNINFEEISSADNPDWGMAGSELTVPGEKFEPSPELQNVLVSIKSYVLNVYEMGKAMDHLLPSQDWRGLLEIIDSLQESISDTVAGDPPSQKIFAHLSRISSHLRDSENILTILNQEILAPVEHTSKSELYLKNLREQTVKLVQKLLNHTIYIEQLLNVILGLNGLNDKRYRGYSDTFGLKPVPKSKTT